MKEFKNAAGKRVCDYSEDGKTAVIEIKGYRTVISVGKNGKLIIKNDPVPLKKQA